MQKPPLLLCRRSSSSCKAYRRRRPTRTTRPRRLSSHKRMQMVRCCLDAGLEPHSKTPGTPCKRGPGEDWLDMTLLLALQICSQLCCFCKYGLAVFRGRIVSATCLSVSRITAHVPAEVLLAHEFGPTFLLFNTAILLLSLCTYLSFVFPAQLCEVYGDVTKLTVLLKLTQDCCCAALLEELETLVEQLDQQEAAKQQAFRRAEDAEEELEAIKAERPQTAVVVGAFLCVTLVHHAACWCWSCKLPAACVPRCYPKTQLNRTQKSSRCVQQVRIEVPLHHIACC